MLSGSLALVVQLPIVTLHWSSGLSHRGCGFYFNSKVSSTLLYKHKFWYNHYMLDMVDTQSVFWLTKNKRKFEPLNHKQVRGCGLHLDGRCGGWCDSAKGVGWADKGTGMGSGSWVRVVAAKGGTVNIRQLMAKRSKPKNIKDLRNMRSKGSEPAVLHSTRPEIHQSA